jgi:uncharacterized protein (TIGR02145 family)
MRILLVFGILQLLVSCQKQIELETTHEEITNQGTQRSSEVQVCHRTGNTSWQTITINENAVEAHLAHGDIIADADRDGFTKMNPCSIGSQNDCDDNNAAINPGVEEVCDNNIDDNCNGEIDENCIQTVEICGKTWMLKNLNVVNYRDGTPIPHITDDLEWQNATTGGWRYYQHSTANGMVYGKLYNRYAVMDPRGLAPAGWHIPSSEEWLELINCLGGWMVAGAALKSTTGWSNNEFCTNTSGFTALPGGFGDPTGEFGNIGDDGVWWSTSQDPINPPYDPIAYNLGGGSAEVITWFATNQHGLYVRCVKD